MNKSNAYLGLLQSVKSNPDLIKEIRTKKGSTAEKMLSKPVVKAIRKGFVKVIQPKGTVTITFETGSTITASRPSPKETVTITFETGTTITA